MMYKYYAGEQDIFDALRVADVLSSRDIADLKSQIFEASSDRFAIGEVMEFMRTTGIPVRVLTRIGDQDEEIIVHIFGN